MDPNYAQLFLGLLLGILIAFLVWKAGSLSPSGALAAALTGGLIFGLGGLTWASLLLVFFISSSSLSRAFQNRKAVIQEKFSKGFRRDWAQVLANGGLGIVLVILHALLPDHAWPWVAYAGAMAAVNADTWATEVGVLSPIEPRLITWWKNSGKPVDKGTSGGITALGTLAALAGATLIAVFAATLNLQSGNFFRVFVAVALGGLVGSLFDSFLGATVQAIYYCPVCAKETERTPRHICGNETVYLRGWCWMNNDWVNFFCALVGAGVAVALVL
jgi:uncharacterized protein (TIGR00297 family)